MQARLHTASHNTLNCTHAAASDSVDRLQLHWSYPLLAIDNSNGQFPLLAPAVSPYVSACRFDRLGSLLACASSSGRLAILDMDIALAQPLRQPARPVCAEAVRSYDMPESDS